MLTHFWKWCMMYGAREGRDGGRTWVTKRGDAWFDGWVMTGDKQRVISTRQWKLGKKHEQQEWERWGDKDSEGSEGNMRREKEEVGNFPASISCAGLSECDVIIALFNYSSTLRAEGRGIMECPLSSLTFPFFCLSFTFSFLSVCVSKNVPVPLSPGFKSHQRGMCICFSVAVSPLPPLHPCSLEWHR